ncbi:rhodanese-like domain-containing protein [Streptomyces sp. ZYX-F-203]
MTTPTALGITEARARLHELTVVDVRTPGEHAVGHLPGALNVPLDRIPHLLPELREASARGDLLLVCASGARSLTACRLLADQGVEAATLTGGTGAWIAEGHEVHRASGAPRRTWGMERQVRLAAGALVLLGLLLAVLAHPAALVLSALVAGGLVFSAVTDTCGMAAVLARLPHNRPRPADLAGSRAALRGR